MIVNEPEIEVEFANVTLPPEVMVKYEYLLPVPDVDTLLLAVKNTVPVSLLPAGNTKLPLTLTLT